MAGGPRTVDEYLAALSEDKRAALEKLRKTIRSAAPKAEECISYQIAAFEAGRAGLARVSGSGNGAVRIRTSRAGVGRATAWPGGN
jgi:hypothetical protein